MSKEGLSFQYDMFSGELVDSRSDSQKKKDKERSTPQQTQMFKTPEMVQFGGKIKSAYRDWLDHATVPPLVLEILDTRTAEEIERDLMREAEKLMTPMFTEEPPATVEDQVPLQENPVSQQQPTVIFEAKQHQCQRGLRSRLRTQSIPVRRRF
ncbi:MAG: hypothetical protein GC179_18385 [Anaerolineaceae bacterium]|nr:hypothetical protein [Anaerolineaceae bacterium]